MLQRGVFLLVLLSATIFGQQDNDRQRVSFDSVTVTRNLGHDVHFSGRLPLAEAYDKSEIRREGESLIESDFLQDSIMLFGDMEAFEEGRANVSVQGGRLVVEGSPAVIARARETLAFYEGLVATPLAVEIWALPGQGGGVLTANQVRAKLQNDGARLVARRDVFPGQEARISSHFRDRFVADYDVEVAQEAVTSEAVIATLVTGLTADLFVDWVGSSSVFVDYALLDAKLTGMEDVVVATAEAGTLQLPRVRSKQFGGTAVVPLGGAVQCSVRGQSFLLRFQGTAPSFDFDGRAIAVPTGSITSMMRTFPAVALSHRLARAGDPDDSDREERAPTRVEYLDEFVQRVGGEAFEMDENASLVQFGSRMLIKGSPKTTERVAKAVRKFRDELLSQRRVDVRVVSIPARSVDVHQAAADSKDVLSEGTLTVVGGRPFRLLAGDEKSQVRKYFVQIAQKATGHQPAVGKVFEGMVLDGRFENRADGRIAFRGAFALSSARSAMSRQPRLVFEKDRRRGEVSLPATHDRLLEIATVLDAQGGWQLVSVVDGGETPRAILMRLTDF